MSRFWEAFWEEQIRKSSGRENKASAKGSGQILLFFFFFSSKELKVPIIVQLSNKSRGNLKGICNNRKIVCPRDEEGFTLWL